MLQRVKDESTGVVHFINPAHAGYTLCTRTKGTDLLGEYAPIGPKTQEIVTCEECAKVVCAIRNEPYNTLFSQIDDATAESGVYAAVEPPTEVKADSTKPSVAAPIQVITSNKEE